MRVAAACYCKKEALKLRRRATAAAGSTPESSAASDGMLACTRRLFSLRMWLQQKLTRIRRAAGGQKNGTKTKKKQSSCVSKRAWHARSRTFV